MSFGDIGRLYACSACIAIRWIKIFVILPHDHRGPALMAAGENQPEQETRDHEQRSSINRLKEDSAFEQNIGYYQQSWID